MEPNHIGDELSKYRDFLATNKYKLLALPAAGAMVVCLFAPGVSQSNWAALYWAVFFTALAAFYASPWELEQWNGECYRSLLRSAQMRRLKLVTPKWSGYMAEYDFLDANDHSTKMTIKELLALPKR